MGGLLKLIDQKRMDKINVGKTLKGISIVSNIFFIILLTLHVFKVLTLSHIVKKIIGVLIFNILFQFLKSDIHVFFIKIKQKRFQEIIRNELCQGRKSGLYKHGKFFEFPPFRKWYEKTIESLGGDRQDIGETILREFEKDEPKYRKELAKIGCCITDSIPLIKHRFDQMPSPLADKAEFSRKKIQRIEADISSLGDVNHPFTRSIYQGMKKKMKKKNNDSEGSFEDGDVDEKILQVIGDIRRKKEKVLNEYIKEKRELEKDMKINKDYLSWKSLSDSLLPFFSMWEDVDKKIGKDSNIRGAHFEQESCKYGLHYIIKEKLELNLWDVKIIKNLKWVKSDGEVDVVIMDRRQTKFLALVECKARCFDICEGWRQSSGKYRKLKKKKWLMINGKKMIVPFDTKCFVMTLIQEHEYQLKFESLMKDKLNKVLMKFDVIYTDFQAYCLLRQFFCTYNSPLEWLVYFWE